MKHDTNILLHVGKTGCCCVSKISSDGGCQSKETGVGMEVRLLSVGARAFFLAASRLSFAASPFNPVAPNEKKPLAPRIVNKMDPLKVLCNQAAFKWT